MKIETVITYGNTGQNFALAALRALGYMPGLYIGQDPSCYISIQAEEIDGKTYLIWDFGKFGDRVWAGGKFTGVRLGYRLTFDMFVDCTVVDGSIIFDTFEAASEKLVEMRSRKFNNLTIKSEIIID